LNSAFIDHFNTQLLLHIREVPGLNLDPEAGRAVFVVFLSPSRQITEYYFKQGIDCLVPHFFQFTVHTIQPNILHCTVLLWATAITQKYEFIPFIALRVRHQNTHATFNAPLAVLFP
jgi:hypothetical protein